jgi:M6 family metalloprotease-like protein
MPATRTRRPGLTRIALLFLLLAASARVSSASPEGLYARSPEREMRIRAALTPESSHATQLEALQRRRAPDTLRVLVVGCDFSDSLMWGRDLGDYPEWPPQRRQSRRIPGTDILVFAAHDSTYFDLQLQRVNAYYQTVSFNALDLDWTVYPEIQNLPRPMSWFADPDSGIVRLSRMAQDIADDIDAQVDFTNFDTLLLIHAGAGAETDINGDSPEQIPSNYLDERDFQAAVEAGLLAVPRIVTTERDLEHVLVLPESETQDPLAGVPGSGFFDVRGVYCFELGLRLGMLSLADFTPSSFPDSQGIGNFGLMGYGLFTGLGIVPAAPSAINRMLMGWVPAVEVSANATLRVAAMGNPATAVSDTVLVRVPISDREYWLAEYRLQDPDGDLFYGFDDLNGNRFPDYFDQSNAVNGGIPNSNFDPTEDTWEDETGAEVDFFMSENPARPPSGCRRGGGSGLYLWHIDEQVIENALIAGSNTINADAAHKGVDVEEADGIQDLDSAQGSPWLLGGDSDTWRGEGAHEFGPGTSPSTATAAGLPTGVRFSEISRVVQDSFPMSDGFCTGFVYTQTMSFRVEFGVATDGPVEQARIRMDGYGPLRDLRVADLGTGPSQPAADGRDEIIAVADSGRVLVFSGDLSGYGPAGPEPGAFAVATAGDTLKWTGPTAVVDFDSDGVPDLLTGANAGIFGFDLNGVELLGGDGNPSTNGRLADPAGEGLSAGVLDGAVVVQTVQAGADFQLVAISEDPLGGIRIVRSNPVTGVTGSAFLSLVDPDAVWAGFLRDGRSSRARFNLVTGSVQDEFDPTGFASNAAALVDLPGLGPAAIWPDTDGVIRAGSTPLVAPTRSGQDLADLLSPVIAVLTRENDTDWVIAVATPDELWALDANLSVRPGFPVRVRGSVASSDQQRLVDPVAADLDGDGEIELLWCDAAGGIHAVDLRGRELPGWPVQGPASPVSAPALGQFDDDPGLEMAVAGRFERLITSSDSGAGFISRPVGEIRIYEVGTDVNGFRPWGQASGGVHNRGRQLLTTGTPPGDGVVGNSLSVRPNPATGPTVWLRAEAAGTIEAHLDIYTIEGERVLSRGPLTVPAGTAMDIELAIDTLGSGTYICQLTGGGKTQRCLLAVVR